MRRPVLAGLAVVALLVGGCSSSPSSSNASPTGSAAGTGDPAAAAASAIPDRYLAKTDQSAQFVVDCDFSHRAKNDPIVFPDLPGKSHSHDFFGNVATDAASTTQSLAGHSTTCTDNFDTAAYWVPTLSIVGQPVDPVEARVYYRAPVGSDVRTVQPPPDGLELLAGTPKPTKAQDTAIVGWGCGWSPPKRLTAPPGNCTLRSPLTMRLLFPDCWDGQNLRVADHRSHMAYSSGGACPASHRVLITQIQVTIEWPLTGPTALLALLSSGGQNTGHGDFLNAWSQDRLKKLVDLCIRPQANCNNA